MMQATGRKYVQYINRIYRRSGTLWEGRYKASLIDSDAWLLTCMRYIEMNPVRAGMLSHPGEYRWSSYTANAQGLPNSLLRQHDLYLALGDDPADRQYTYRGETGTFLFSLRGNREMGEHVKNQNVPIFPIFHEASAQVAMAHAGIPWLGFVVYPDHRRVKGRKVRNTRRALAARLAAYHAGAISFAALDASVAGWINHVRYADSWGLRKSVLHELVIEPARHQRSQERQKKSRGR